MGWDKEQVGRYQTTRIRNPILSGIYILAGIPITEPEERARYLSENLRLTATDHDLVLRTSSEKGVAEGLKLLEEMAISLYG